MTGLQPCKVWDRLVQGGGLWTRGNRYGREGGAEGVENCQVDSWPGPYVVLYQYWGLWTARIER